LINAQIKNTPVKIHLPTYSSLLQESKISSKKHGRGEKIWFDYRYSNEELDPWVPKVQKASKSVKKVVGFFNNHYHGYAPENCLYMLQQLGLVTGPQKRAKDKSRIKQAQLGSFFG
jgi:uncharacterized protein YecE (DUF72 family)